MFVAPDGRFCAEARPKPGSLSLVPILRGDEFGAGGFGKRNRPHYGRRGLPAYLVLHNPYCQSEIKQSVVSELKIENIEPCHGKL